MRSILRRAMLPPLRADDEGLLEAEGVEALADGHGADGVAGLYADVQSRWRGVGGLEDDLVADALDDGVDGVAEGFEGLAGEAAGAGFVAREGCACREEGRACRLARGRRLRRSRRGRRRR